MIRQYLQMLRMPHAPSAADDDAQTWVLNSEARVRDVPQTPDPVVVSRKFCAMMLGVGEWREQSPNAYERVVHDELKGMNASWHKHEQLLPRLPQVFPQLMRTLRNPDATLGNLTDIVARDPVLVAAVTRTVNSAYFNSTRSVSNLRDAVLLVGHDGLRRLLPTIAMQPIFHANGGRFCTLAGPHVWAHAQRCALAGMLLVSGKSDAEAFEHYLAGLALGASLIIVVRTLDAQQPGDGCLQSAQFADAMLRNSHALAVRVAAQWTFPAGTTTALRELVTSDQTADRRSVLAQAEYLAMAHALARGGHLGDEPDVLRVQLPGVAPSRLKRCHAELLRFDEADVLA